MTTAVVDSMFNTMQMLREDRNADFNDEQARKKAKWDDEDRALKEQERKRAEALRVQLEADAAPTLIDSEEHGPTRPEGLVGPDGKPLAPVERVQVEPTVNGKTFKTMAEALAAKAAYDAPHAVMQRQGMTALRAGNPEGAAKVMDTGMRLADTERKAVHAAYLDDLRQSVQPGDWKGAAAFMDRTGDPNIKGQFVPSADGKKMVMQRINPDGSTEPLGEFDNTPEGFAELLMLLERVPAEKLLEHQNRKQTRLDNKFYNDERLKDFDAAATQRKLLNDAQIAAYNRRGTGGDGGDGADRPVGQVDMGAIDKVVDDYFATRNEEGKLIAPADPALKARVRALAAMSPAAVAGDEEGAALTAAQIYKDAMATAGGDLNKAHLLVSAQLEERRNPSPGGYTVRVGGEGSPVMTIGRPEMPGAPGRAGSGPAPRGAMAQIAAEEQAKARAKQEAEAQAKAQRQGEIDKVAQLTKEQIAALSPDEARRLLDSKAGRAQPVEVRNLLKRQAAGSTAPRPMGRGFGG